MFSNHTRRWVMAFTVLSTTFSALAQPWVDDEAARKLLREEKFTEAAAAYGKLAEANPYDGESWSQYGYCLHAAKKYDEALKAFAKAINLGFGIPNNTYNTACAHALLGHKDEALKWLEKSLNARFSEQQTLETDTDVDSLRSDPRFAALTGITKGLKDKPAATREEGWAWDLDFFARRMKQMHWDLYAKVPEATFKAELEKLKTDIKGGLSDAQARLRLRKITALVGDGHTASRLIAEGDPRRALPIHMFAFKDGLYIIGTGKGNESLLGARIVKFGPLESDDAMAAVRPYASVDNDMGYLGAGPALLSNIDILQAIGATKEPSVELTVRDAAGKQRQIRLEPTGLPETHGGGGTFQPTFSYLHQTLKSPLPLFLRNSDKPLHMEHLSEHKLVYFWFGAVMNSPDVSLRDFTEKLFDFIAKNPVEHLVIDMRFNGGGNTGLIRPFINRLIADGKVNKPGHLWVIIGRHTFSAAQNTVNLLDKQTDAIFVGEPTGSRPAFVGESTNFILPHSKTRVFCSSRYWQFMDSTDQRTWVQPTIAADMTFADYATGKDAPMDAILKWVDKGEAK